MTWSKNIYPLYVVTKTEIGTSELGEEHFKSEADDNDPMFMS